MPAGVVKTKRDERLWSKAKGQAKKQDRDPEDEGGENDRDWAYTMGIFKKMKGGKKGMVAIVKRAVEGVPAIMARQRTLKQTLGSVGQSAAGTARRRTAPAWGVMKQRMMQDPTAWGHGGPSAYGTYADWWKALQKKKGAIMLEEKEKVVLDEQMADKVATALEGAEVSPEMQGVLKRASEFSEADAEILLATMAEQSPGFAAELEKVSTVLDKFDE